MIELLQSGAYLVNGTEIIPEGPEAAAAIKSKTEIVPEYSFKISKTDSVEMLSSFETTFEKSSYIFTESFIMIIIDYMK